MDDNITSAIPNNGNVTPNERKLIFYLGVGGLLFVPVFKSITHPASVCRHFARSWSFVGIY